jgi:uncharacterized SAM-binding protein YcdF (DUF218 family)
MTLAHVPPPATHADIRRRGRALLRRIYQATIVGCWVVLALLAIGFVWFAGSVADDEVRLDGKADGIVALTGGASRLADAVNLLASGRGRRLLISGVSPTTNVGDLKRQVPDHERWFGCCIDLDYSAVNTIGNAVETRRWALGHGFRSLVVVTSSYHMPRAMLELSHQMPGVTLVAYPVVTPRRRAEGWWSDPASARLLMLEYLKYVVANARTRLEPSPTGTTVAASRERTKI